MSMRLPAKYSLAPKHAKLPDGSIGAFLGYILLYNGSPVTEELFASEEDAVIFILGGAKASKRENRRDDDDSPTPPVTPSR